ncbi:EEF1A lysine methyltransferase 3-like [Amblyraja radiata]|uniref:EEF1A lysine methyltransferase 3-like n=1 Tax=Amblyraja radiata TaxID=386614 RepID=UPI001401F894|nr:EEF1A lysine methyltransferase 3-like [Amblyraja radiata]
MIMVFSDQNDPAAAQTYSDALTSGCYGEAAWRSDRSSRTMQALPEKTHAGSSDSKMETSKLESYYHFCGKGLRITRDLSNNLGISAIIWESGLVLCRYFQQEKIDFLGKKVIELGSGTGIVGILATLLGGDVTLTDQPSVLRQIEFNVATNVPKSNPSRAIVCPLRWGENQSEFPADFDVILGSDIVYSPLHFQGLIQTLRHLSSHTTVIYISSKMREVMGAKEFHEKILPQYFNWEIVHRNEEKEINVYKVTKKNSGTTDQPLP